MSAHALYEEVCTEFPTFYPEDHEWENVHDGQEAKLNAISSLISRHIKAHKLLVVVHHLQIAAEVSKESAVAFVAKPVLSGEIQISDPEFTSFVVISESGVATGWQK